VFKASVIRDAKQSTVHLETGWYLQLRFSKFSANSIHKVDERRTREKKRELWERSMRAWNCSQNTPHAINDRSKSCSLTASRHSFAPRASRKIPRLSQSSHQNRTPPTLHPIPGSQQCRSSASSAPFPEGSSQTVPEVSAQPIASPLPPLPSVDRGDNTLQRTISGVVLAALGSFCIYSGGLLFTGGLFALFSVYADSR